MRDVLTDPASTGPDYYFETAIQCPEFEPSSSSSSPNSLTRKYVFLPAALSSYRGSNDPKHHHGEVSESCCVEKDVRDSPGSNGTGKTASTSLHGSGDGDNDDLDSHCGSLTYSVESWGPGNMLQDDIDDGTQTGVEADKDETGGVATDDLLLPAAAPGGEGDAHDDCMAIPCFPTLSWVHSWVQESFQKVDDFQDQVQNAYDYERQLGVRQRLSNERTTYRPRRTCPTRPCRSGTKS